MRWLAGLLVGAWLGCSSGVDRPAGTGGMRESGVGDAGGSSATPGGNAGSAGAPAGGHGGSGGGGGAGNADAGAADRPPSLVDGVRSGADGNDTRGSAGNSADAGGQGMGRSEETPVNPEYNESGALVRPLGWEQWIFLGSALNLSYSTGSPPNMDVLSFVYMEPTAYRHFKATGQFREGTMTALATYRAGAAGPPAERGIVPTAPGGFEMSVKDRTKTPEGWGYYSFDGGPNATRGTARPFPRSACFDCHDEHAETDHVFTQYYPVLP